MYHRLLGKYRRAQDSKRGSNFAVHSGADSRCPHAGDGETVDGSADYRFNSVGGR